MFAQNTVLILGAGSSIPFGLPSGVELKERILNGLKAIRSGVSGGVLSHDPRFLNSFRSTPTQYLYGCLPDTIQKSTDWSLASLMEFEAELRDSPQETIDRFLFDNERFRQVGKALITTFLIHAAYELNKSGATLHFKRFTSIDNVDWVSALITKIREGAESGEDLEENNQLRIVTFNYDTVLEHILEKHLCRTERHSGGNPKKIAPILHVHGKIEMPDQIEGSELVSLILQQSESFSLIREKSEESFFNFSETNQDLCRNAVQEADHLFALGFAFDQYNTEILDLDNFYDINDLYVQNYDGHLGLNKRLLKIGVPQENILSGQPESPMDCMRAFALGFLE